MSKETKELLLLDTHIWIWLMNGDKRLESSKSFHLIRKENAHRKILISIISVWEVGMLEAKGKIEFPFSCLEWAQRALRAPGVSLVQLTPEIAIESSRLQGKFHGDPADRILVATVKSLGAMLITQDENILSYCKKQNIFTL